jgi:hypothetical protein
MSHVRLKSEAFREDRDDRCDVEDHLVGVGVLSRLAVQPTLEGKVVAVAGLVLVTIHGPKGPNVSKPLPLNHWA